MHIAGSTSMTANDLQKIDQRCINTLRTLAIDPVEKAHPGTPMGPALTAYCLWQRFLRVDPDDAAWPDRDRFVLSVGHASALLCGLPHLCGVKAATQLAPEREGPAVTMADLQSFRQAGSRCTGHPEHGWTTGVKTTTGPLGQGLATSVRMAIAQAWLAATYNRLGFALFEHRVFALAGDGDMMEGISAEAASLAGHLKLDRLCWIYDRNQISIEGSTHITFTENVSARFTACGSQVLQVLDANDIETTALALRTFKNTGEQPTLIIVHSHIGYSAPHKQASAAAHGEPLSADEARAAKQFYGFDPDASFAVPAGVRDHLHANFGQRGTSAHKLWRARFAATGKTVVSTQLIDRVAARLGRPCFEVPVGFKWFSPGLLDGSLGFAGEESAGSAFLRRDGTAWTTDKDALIAGLRAAEITARCGRDPGGLYLELADVLGLPVADRIETAATVAQKKRLAALSPSAITATELAGKPLIDVLSHAPGSGAPIGGIKVVAKSGWYAARPSGTEDIYKIYAESFQGRDHLQRILTEAQATVDAALIQPSNQASS
jgi:transketolase N-terminal domain/subunit